MPKIKYLDKKFSEEKLDLIETINQIIVQYRAQGFRLTLRQLYYRLVANDLFSDNRKYLPIPGTNKWQRHPQGTKNAEPNYDFLGALVSDGRVAGLIDWDAIEDRTRELGINSRWDEPTDILKSAASWYQNDLWRWQPVRPEVWVEKDALEAVVQRACQPLDVPYFSCRGYTSQSSMWEAAQRLLGYREDLITYDGEHQRKGGQEFRQKTLIFHLGDHDPSGIDMSRDIEDRLSLFCGRAVEVRRIALNMNQVKQYAPPPNPAKVTDSRFQSYQEKYGDESWELDALEPNVIVALIQEHLFKVMDKERFDEAVAIMEKGRKELLAIRDNYDRVLKTALKEKK
jgi:hypothetical protein